MTKTHNDADILTANGAKVVASMVGEPPEESPDPKFVGKVSQFRLYRDANLLIPIHKVSKTRFVHDAVAAAANNPAVLGWALVHRGSRLPQSAEQQSRISIATSIKFQENVDALATTFRMTNEEVVRLAVEAAVFQVDPRDLAKRMAADILVTPKESVAA